MFPGSALVWGTQSRIVIELIVELAKFATRESFRSRQVAAATAPPITESSGSE
jgi:hypothetical protein